MSAMNKNDSPKKTLPRAREEALEVQELAGETLVYDLDRHRAHALNEAASLVWRSCNGKTSYEAVARRMENRLGIAADEELVRLIVARLGRAHLLERTPRRGKAYSRRELLRTMQRLGLAASALLPLVSSVVAPTEVYALSCVEQVDCRAVADCTPCFNPGGNCNPAWRCCGGECVTPGIAATQCGCT